MTLRQQAVRLEVLAAAAHLAAAAGDAGVPRVLAVLFTAEPTRASSGLHLPHPGRRRTLAPHRSSAERRHRRDNGARARASAHLPAINTRCMLLLLANLITRRRFGTTGSRGAFLCVHIQHKNQPPNQCLEELH